jgi:selenocysteine-specific translation elongation factor
VGPGFEHGPEGKGYGMQEITELEKRITSALERIGKGVDRLATQPRAQAPAAVAAPATDSALRAQLEEEKSLTSQLQARLRAASAREAKGDLQDKVDRLTQELDVKGLELQRMRRVNATLREQLEALRSAQTAGVTEPHLINKAMLAELDALRATRLTEIAEMDDILAALEPHLSEVGNA